MIRVLVMIAIAGFLVSVVSLSVAVGIAGPDAIARGAWAWGPGHWDFGRYEDHWDGRHHRWNYSWDNDGGGPQTTREIAWTGGDSLDVDLPADVEYTQGSGPAKLIVTGPQKAVADVEIQGGHVRFAHDRHRWAELTIVMTAPSVTRFEMSGSGKLAIANYKQDKLNLDLSGDADVSAKGEARAVDLTISGSASADLGELKTRAATVDIAGSGDATLAPTESAKLDISGSGDVTLLTRPPKLESNISGSGNIHQEERETATPPPAPAPSAKRGRT